ncbi:hypothetical protein RHSIM_Rhsim12G0152200 [Rhododendron simsii]|uniref:Disease resistance R13L4/SHOC-2-like LRR domain-containing protein n=1 Tax=Rhododendron simsii TaxID=118357 RepID=A0A834G2M1_RHOSS|nr:hypothetical protein RHSIM_Rhsim12G0152200 [Rhododendron simsii]
MGCCSSKNVDSKATRMARWRSTGIVALRDSKLKTFPDEVLDLDKSVRTLDLTHNRLDGDTINWLYWSHKHAFAHSNAHTLADSKPFGNLIIVFIVDDFVILINFRCSIAVAYAVDIPMEISKLINLQRLVLADNLIEHLPVNVGKLQYLKIMTLDANQITLLPDELGQLVRLERLSISGNLLTRLPETIGSLRNLVLLNVSNNKLEFLPESIGSCFSLEELQANENSIADLPSSVCNLIHLKSLCLDNNNVKQMEGFQEFETRRRKKFDKQIDANVMISSKGLDEGVDL